MIPSRLASCAPLFLVFWLVLSLGFNEALAQRISYQALQAREWVPSAYFNYSVLPPSEPGQDAELVISFKIEYDYLNFRRNREAGDDEDREFYAEVEINVEVFESKSDGPVAGRQPTRIQRSAQSQRGRSDQSTAPDLRDRVSVGRDFWNGKAYAATYEQTRSKSQYLEGFISKSLPPGNYDITANVRSDRSSRHSGIRTVNIPDFSDTFEAQFYMLNTTRQISVPSSVPLINMGQNVYYGKDFTTLILIPGYEEHSAYRLRLKKLDFNNRDTSAVKTIFDKPLDDGNLLRGLGLGIGGDDGSSVDLVMRQADSPYTFAQVSIPNRQFENAHYRMELIREEDDKPVGRKVFLNRWVDIPTSLLNVDVALDMLQFIVDDDELARLRRGNQRQREENFREFWKQRDPTPENEYNELMVEYYRRIDYAYENFTSPTRPGYETDMGRTYILNGEPQRITRRFPPNRPAVEVWEYGERTFTFVATTGFGDYELRETS